MESTDFSPVQWNIFVVDDDLFHLNIMEQIVKDILPEATIHLYESGPDCLAHIQEAPNLVFLDHKMDVYSGYEVLNKIKRFSPDIFVVMVSAQEDIQTAVDSLKHGAFDYIQKNEHLQEQVQRVIKKLKEVMTVINTPKPGFFSKLFYKEDDDL